MRGTLLLAFVALVALLPGRSVAQACSCVRDPIQVFPGRYDLAPPDTHIWLLVEHPLYVGSDEVPLAELEVTVRSDDGDVAVARRVYGSEAVRVIELVPTAPLTPGARVAVITRARGVTEARGEFSVGKRVAVKRPRAPWIAAADYQKGYTAACGSGAPAIDLTLHPLGHNDPRVRYEIWMSDREGDLDYSRAPATLTDGEDGYIFLGSSNLCRPSNLRIPRDGRTVYVGVKAVDYAGHRSDATELAVHTR